MSPVEERPVHAAHRARTGAVRLPVPPLRLLDDLGGEDGVRELCEALYERIRQDPELAPLFPHFQSGGLAGMLSNWWRGKVPHGTPWASGLYERHLVVHLSSVEAERWPGTGARSSRSAGSARES